MGEKKYEKMLSIDLQHLYHTKSKSYNNILSGKILTPSTVAKLVSVVQIHMMMFYSLKHRPTP